MKIFVFTLLILTMKLIPCKTSEDVSKISLVKPSSTVSEISTKSDDLDVLRHA